MLNIDIDRMVGLLKDGHAVIEVANILGTSKQTIRNRMNQIGYKKTNKMRDLSKNKYQLILNDMKQPSKFSFNNYRWAISFREKMRSCFDKSYENYLNTGKIIL